MKAKTPRLNKEANELIVATARALAKLYEQDRLPLLTEFVDLVGFTTMPKSGPWWDRMNALKNLKMLAEETAARY